MKNVNNRNELVKILLSLDSVDYEQIKIKNMSMDLFYDDKNDKYIVFDKCEWIFDTLEELEGYIVEEYQLYN